ncbi:MAG: aspartate dehydrogenase [Pseudomonadota bacterium]
MTRGLKIAVVGCGAIAKYVVDHIQPVEEIAITNMVCREPSRAKAEDFAAGRFPVVVAVDQLSPKPDLLVDCAGHSGLSAHAPSALKAGIEVISISTGALADETLLEILHESARLGSSAIRFLSGAVGGIDALLSAHAGGLENVIYTGRKPPEGWAGSPAEGKCNLAKLKEPFEHFSGTAREAARLYPKNANVAATIALASIGLDQVTVRLVADPGVDKNIHEIDAVGAFGSLSVKLHGNPLPDNPKSSALAAMSIVSELKRRTQRVGI